jgi:hypothetical protein
MLKTRSFRAITDDYWNGKLSTAVERELEDRTPKELLIGYKPVARD